MSKTVLVIEDHQTTREHIHESLSAAGFGMLEAGEAQKGVQLALQNPVDLILLDVQLPDQSGFSTLQQLKGDSRTRNIPIIMCTAQGMKEDIVTALNLGATGYIIKPFQKKTLVEKVVKTIGLPGA